MTKESNILLQKLDDFITRYYRNEIIKGLIYSFLIVICVFLFINYAEYFFGFNGVVRAIFYFGFLLAFLLSFGLGVIKPVSRLLNIGRDLNYEKAAQIVGKHFAHVEDRLLNALYLNDQKANALAVAMVEKRGNELNPVPFQEAIDRAPNKKGLKYLLAVLGLGFLTFALLPELFFTGTNHIVNYHIPFEKQAPFTFNLQNENLRVKRGDDLNIRVDITGQSVPENLNIVYAGSTWSMKKEGSEGSFSLTLKNIRSAGSFFFATGKYQSEEYEIDLIDVPELMGFSMEVRYPDYLEKESQTFAGVSELTLPAGSEITWNFDVKNTRDILFIPDSLFSRSEPKTHLLKEPLIYSIVLEGSEINDTAVSNFTIDVIEDKYPDISVEMRRDSTGLNTLYFLGEVSDDNGLLSLDVNIFGERITIERFGGKLSGRFFYTIDLDTVETNNEGIYFEIFDNDAVSGYKSSKSEVFAVQKLNSKEISKVREEKNKDLEKDLEELKQLSEEMSREINEFQEELIKKEKTDWQDKKRLEDLLEKHKEFQKKSDRIKDKKEELSELNEKNFDMSEELKEKQKKLDELFDKLMEDEELRDLFEEMEKLREEMNKDELLEKLDDMEFNQDDISEQLDREMELFKRLELEKDWEDAADRMDELREKQEELSENEELTDDERQEAQDELNEEFEDLKEKVKEMEERAEELDMEELDVDDEAMEEIESDMQDASDKAGDGDSDGSKEKQKDAAEKMGEMSDAMSSAMQSQQAAQMEVDMDALRMIQENLIRLSFRQEDVMTEYGNTNVDNPRYVELTVEQNNIVDDTKMVEDSLRALSKRLFFLEETITKELKELNRNLTKTVSHMVEREKRNGGISSREAMKSYNNLALLIGEMLQQMQQQMAQQKFGEGNCNKPGSASKPGKGQMKKMKEQLKKNMEKMKDMLGKDDGGGKEEGKGEQEGGAGGDKSGQSEQLSKMIGQQKAMRNALRQMAAEEAKKEGGGAGDKLKEIEKKLEDNEEDLVNQRIDLETLKRQQEIMSKMLEAENAMREQDKQEERESESGKRKQKEIPQDILDYLQEKERVADLFRKTPAELNRFYKERVNKYFE